MPNCPAAAALLITMFCVSTQVFAKNLVRDGGFESPATPSGGYMLVTAGQKFGPWLVTGPQNSNVGTVSTTFQQDGQVFDARAGLAYMELTGLTNTSSGVSQKIATVPGTTYKLIFWVGAVYDPNGMFATSSTVLVYNGTTLMMTATNALTSNTGKQVWKKFASTFVASSASTTLGFVNGNPYDASHQNCAIDAVSLVAP